MEKEYDEKIKDYVIFDKDRWHESAKLDLRYRAASINITNQNRLFRKFYVENDGVYCPFCKSSEVSGGSFPKESISIEYSIKWDGYITKTVKFCFGCYSTFINIEKVEFKTINVEKVDDRHYQLKRECNMD